MAWGGPEEQKKEIEAGNSYARDWCDDALKVVERTLEEYWRDALDDIEPVHAKTVTQDPVTSTRRALQSEYDRHRQQLLQRATHVNSGGWKEELRRYLNDIPDDITKDVDIVGWWAVHCFSFSNDLFILK